MAILPMLSDFPPRRIEVSILVGVGFPPGAGSRSQGEEYDDGGEHDIEDETELRQ
jgi:hypothetical protein